MRSMRIHLKRIFPRDFWRFAGLLFGIAAITLACTAQVTTTTVQDTVYNADGSYASGTILVTWPAFVTATGETVAAGNVSAQIGTNGLVTLTLAPNIGANPAGTYYTAVYHLNDGTVSKEYWSIPNVASTNIAAIRSLVMPASVAAQTVTATEVTSLLNKYLPLNGGLLSGALQLASDPAAPMQAATKNYVDNIFAPLATAVSQAVTATPKTTQTIEQPPGTNLAANVLQGKYYASQFQSPSGTGNNGIEQLASGTQCATNGPTVSSGCTIVVDPGYSNTDKPQGTNIWANGPSINFIWPMNTHVHDERNGATADYYENPFSMSPFQAAGDLKVAAYTLDFQQFPRYSEGNPTTEALYATDFQGGYNFDNYYIPGQPQYFFKTYYDNLDLTSTNYSSGQMQAIENVVNCHGTGDCLAMSTLLTCDGGMNAGNDEGCHGGDFQVGEDSVVYKGTVNTAVAVGATLIATNGTAGQGTQGEDRLLLDTTPAVVLTGTSLVNNAGALPTGPSSQSALNPDSASDPNAAFPVSTMVQLCYPGSDNGAGGATGCTAGSQPIGFIPSAPNMINPAASITTNVVASYTGTSGTNQTGLPAGFCTPTTLQSSNSAAACYLPASGTACIADQDEYETVDYTYNTTAQTITLLNLRFPHGNGVFFAHGGLCGYGVEQQSDVFSGDGNNNGISQVFPVEGSPNATTFYYISQRTNEGYSQPVLGLSNEQGGNTLVGGGECINGTIINTVLQSDGHTVQVTSNEAYNLADQTFSILNGLPVTITTPNSTYNGTFTASWGSSSANSNENQFTYYLSTAPTGTVPTSGTISYCNTNYKMYPSVRVTSVLNASTNKVDGTMTTMPSPVAFAAGDTVMQAHYPWIYTGHDTGRAVTQFQPRFYNGGYLYGMSYDGLLSGSPFTGFGITNNTDQSRYLRYGGTHEPPGFAYRADGEWQNDFAAGQAPANAVINILSCKPSPIGCNDVNSPFNFLLAPNNGEALNYDPMSQTWTFGNVGSYRGNPPVPSAGTLQSYNFNAANAVGVKGAYLFNLGGAIGITTTPASPVFNNWYANYAYGFGPQNTTIIDGYLYRGATANSIDCGTGTGDTSCTFTLGVLNAGSSVNAPVVAASSSISTPSMTVGGGSAVSHIAYYATGSITPVAVPAQTCSDQTFTVSGLVQADAIGSIHPGGALGNLSLEGYASGANTLTMHFCNVSAVSVVPPAGNYTFLAMH